MFTHDTHKLLHATRSKRCRKIAAASRQQIHDEKGHGRTRQSTHARSVVIALEATLHHSRLQRESQVCTLRTCACQTSRQGAEGSARSVSTEVATAQDGAALVISARYQVEAEIELFENNSLHHHYEDVPNNSRMSRDLSDFLRRAISRCILDFKLKSLRLHVYISA